MNLAYEYLLRQGVSNSLFETPCSLFLSHALTRERLVVTIEDHGDNKFIVKHWFVDRPLVDNVPTFESFYISRSDVFCSNLVIVPEYIMLAFKECRIRHGMNTLRRPMPNYLYVESYDSYLNPSNNKLNREKWLWCSFLKRPAKSVDVPTFLMDQIELKKRDAILWEHWHRWRQRMLYPKCNVAPELIFYKQYEASVISLLKNFLITDPVAVS